ncbi:MAG: DUF4143 domain-containing protein, partial [Acidobacteria bacterium]|nr:DUF4143 domain-containing protein [Acidobacteriota bacterium]
LLQASGIVALVEPYFSNRTKRLAKAPKLIFLDTGLAAFLAGFSSEEELLSSSYAGAFWESYVFGQLTRFYAARGRSCPVSYWRTASGHEVDFLVEMAGAKLAAIECKLKEHPDPGDTAGLRKLAEAEKGRVARKYVLCRTHSSYRLPDGSWAVNLPDLLEELVG